VVKPKWKQLSNSMKPHLFIKGRSLCNKWLYLGQDFDGPWTGNVNAMDCKGCVAVAEKRYPIPKA
jgi:hypothetical protein